MKSIYFYTVSLALGLATSLAQAETESESFVMGGALQFEQSIYKNGKNRVTISPTGLSKDGFYGSGAALALRKRPTSQVYVGLGLG